MYTKPENVKSYRAGFIQCAKDIQSGKDKEALITFGLNNEDHDTYWCSGYRDCRAWFDGNISSNVYDHIGHDYDNFYGQQSFIHPTE